MNGPTGGSGGDFGGWELVSSELAWSGGVWTWAASLAAVSISAALGIAAWRRSGRRGSVAGMELMRTGLIAAVAVLLNQPEWIRSYRPARGPTVAVLVDRSPSMSTEDIPVGDVPVGDVPGGESSMGGVASEIDDPRGDGRVSRAAATEGLVAPSRWATLAERGEVAIEEIGIEGAIDSDATSNGEAATPGSGTDLATPLRRVAEGVEGLGAVVLISDGDWTRGGSPVEAASRLRARGVPLFTVPVGSPTRLPDLELTRVELPSFSPLGKPLRIPYSIESWLGRDVSTTVTVTIRELGSGRDRGEVASFREPVVVAASGRADDAAVWEPPRTGEYEVTLEIPVESEEAVAGNNRVSGQVSIREEQLRVLVVESVPRWEYRYLRNALSRDPGVELSCLLLHPDLDRRGGGSEDYIDEFPGTAEGLSRYDVVILGDVGVGEDQLTSRQCELVRGLVERQASGLVLIPGWQGHQSSLTGSDLGPLIPVRLDMSRPKGIGSSAAGRMRLTESGRRSLLTRLEDDRVENERAWESLPGFQWYAAIERAKPGAEVLAVHGDATNRSGSVPLVVTRPFGAGKVLHMGTDGAWRWREGVEDRYHYRFWGQVVRWMAYQRNMARGESMRMYHTPEDPRVGQPVSLHAVVMDEAGRPVDGGEVMTRVVAPSGRSETVRMSADGGEWGVYRGRFEPSEPGRHEMTLECRDTSGRLVSAVFVGGEGDELPGRPARPDVMRELASVTGGESFEIGRMEEVFDRLANMPPPPPAVRRTAVWGHPLTGAGLVLALTLFWMWRKALGML